MLKGMCRTCSHIITEPVCAHCLLKEANAWTHEQPLDFSRKQALVKDFAKFYKAVMYLDKNNICVVCRQRSWSICSYCVMKEMQILIRKHISSISSLENWNQIFNTKVYEYGLERV